MPWQQHVADVANELDPETGDLVYNEVVITVPRQSGKTTLILPEAVVRATRFGAAQNIVYTAQTRIKARKKWQDEHVMLLNASPFKRRRAFTVRTANGTEAICWANGSMHGIDAPTETAGHGDTLDLGLVDEAWAHVDDRVEAAMAPAMITRRSRQLWVFSTAGNARSAYLWRKVLAGRANQGVPSSTAYFEWSAEEDADPEDPATWWACMPALGHTVTEAAIRGELNRAKRQGKLGDLFLRPYLNRWVEIPVLDEDIPKVIPLAWFDDCADAKSRLRGDRVFAVDVSVDRTTATITVVGNSSRNWGAHVEVVDRRPGAGSDWIIGRLRELVEKWPTKAITAHLRGPVGSYEPELRKAFGEKFRPLKEAEYPAACGMVFDAIHDGAFKHLGSLALREAIDGVAKSTRGDTWVWSRRSALTDITSLVGATCAWFVHHEQPAVVPGVTAKVADQAAAENELWRPTSRLKL